MKKLLLTAIAILAVTLALCSCRGGGQNNGTQHNYGNAWEHDENQHWRVCTDEGCAEVADKADHSFGSGEIDVDNEEKKSSCTVCGYTKVEKYIARTEATAEEWAEALKVEGYLNMHLTFSNEYSGEEPETHTIKYTDEWMMEYGESGGKYREEYHRNAEDTDMGSYEIAEMLNEYLGADPTAFSYDAKTKYYNREIADGDEKVAVSCRFADGVLIYCKVVTVYTDESLTYEFKFSDRGTTVIESQIDNVIAQLTESLNAELFENVTAEGTFDYENFLYYVETKESYGYGKLTEMLDAIPALTAEDVEAFGFRDGVLYGITATEDVNGERHMVTVTLDGGRLKRFSSDRLWITLKDYGTTEKPDGYVEEGDGAPNETPIRPV